MTIRRGLRRILELDVAPTLTGAIQEVEIAGVSYQTPAGGAAEVLSVTEERPLTPSPYDDEFDGPNVSAAWTQTVGTSSDYTINFSRLLTSAAVTLKQTVAFTNPVRIRLGITGWPYNIVSGGPSLFIQGTLKGIGLKLSAGPGGYGRVLEINRYSAAGAYEATLFTSSAYGNNMEGSPLDLVFTLDATNLLAWVGPLGAPRYFYSYARASLGTMVSMSILCDVGGSMSFCWFRVDRATTGYAFPLAWAG